MITNMIPLKIFLYHGTNTKIACPKWNMGYTGRDFGQCFYTTYDRNTAKIWAVKNFKENAIVNKYTINLEKLNDGGLKLNDSTLMQNGLSLFGETDTISILSVQTTTSSLALSPIRI